jgi:hypothetical protein
VLWDGDEAALRPACSAIRDAPEALTEGRRNGNFEKATVRHDEELGDLLVELELLEVEE